MDFGMDLIWFPLPCFHPPEPKMSRMRNYATDCINIIIYWQLKSLSPVKQTEGLIVFCQLCHGSES